jgi:hypothetical protein
MDTGRDCATTSFVMLQFPSAVSFWNAAFTDWRRLEEECIFGKILP